MPIVNVKAMKEHEVDGDWGHAWAQTSAEGTGTGPYKIVQFDPGQQLVMEKNEGYWGGWEGEHFDRIVLRVVVEPATRRQLLEQGEGDIVDSLPAEDVDALLAKPGPHRLERPEHPGPLLLDDRRRTAGDAGRAPGDVPTPSPTRR